MHANKLFYVFFVLQPNVPCLSHFVAGSSTKLDVTSSPCSGSRVTQLPQASEGFNCSQLKRSLVHFSLKGFGIRLLRSAHVNFSPRLRAASPPPSSRERGAVLRLERFPFIFPYLSQGCSAKSSPFSLPSVLPPLSIPKPQFSFLKITPKTTGLPFMCTGTKWQKGFIEVNLCTIEFFLKEICNY